MTTEPVEQLKIAYVFDGCLDDADGVPAYVKTMDAYFSGLGHKVSHIVGESAVNDPRIISMGHAAMVHINGNRVRVPLLTSNRVVQDALDKTDPDIVHIQIPYSPLLGGRFINRAPDEAGVVGTFHILPNSLIASIGTRLLRYMNISSRHRIDHSVSASVAVQSFAESAFGIESTILPCPVDVERFKQGRRLPEYDDGKTNLLFMGRLVERKGCQHLLNALGELNNATNLDNLRVLIAGKGPLKESLVEQAKALGIGQIVDFIGFVEEKDKANVLASADIAVFPATGGESFGIVLAEAMAAGALVMGGDNLGYRNVLGEVAAVLFDPEDTITFAKKIDTLLTTEELHNHIKANQQIIVKQYDVSVVGAKMLDIYHGASNEEKDNKCLCLKDRERSELLGAIDLYLP